MLRRFLVLSVLVVSFVGALAGPARAQPTERRGRYLQNAEFTNVVDALESDDPFDLNLSVGYLRESRTARIRRESNNPGVSPDGYIGTVDLAKYEQLSNTLVLEGAVGLFRDLQFWTRWPLVLSDTRELTLDDGVTLEQSRLRRSCYQDASAGEVCLFDIPFQSPERSGLDAFTLGLDWGILNQLRDDTKPTWVLGVEVTVGIGSALVATRKGEGDGGISRGVTRLTAHTEMSRRYRYLEPYLGVRFSADLPQSDKGFPQPSVEGRLNTVPPLIGSMIFGAEVVPWESMETFQRFSVDLRMAGTFNSEGRTQSELFDALGVSRHSQLTEPNVVGQPDRTFNGMTDIENYGTFATTLALNVQAARYVKFQLGASLAFDQQHGITFTDACNPEADVAIPQAPCSRGAPNPDHRAVIDLPGHRFRVEETTVFQFFATGTAMF